LTRPAFCPSYEFMSSLVSRRIVGGMKWGKNIRGGGDETIARTGKLSAVEVTKAKRPGVLHNGGGLYLRVSATGAKSWVFRFQLSTESVVTWGSAPSPISRSRKPARRPQSTESCRQRQPSCTRSGFLSPWVGPSASAPSSTSNRTGRAGRAEGTGGHGRALSNSGS
jgi:hypothetical protein